MKKFLASWLMLLVNLAVADVRVLTYSSLLDKGGLGDEIKKLAPADLKIEFSSSKDFAGILGTLRRLKRQGKLATVNVVLGLNESHYKSALAEGLIAPGKPYEEASFGILVNKEQFPESQWPKSWKEVGEKMKGKILVQDPRTSQVGLTWLLNATELKNLTLAETKQLPRKVFSDWSSSFNAFESGLAPAIWTYSTSIAYYQCAGDAKASKFANLPLPGYPKDRNYISIVKPTENEDALRFVDLVLSEKVQKEVWQKNWMFPASYPKQLKTMPACYTKVWFPQDSQPVGETPPKELLRQLDQWSL